MENKYLHRNTKPGGQLQRVYEFFLSNVGTSLDASFATGIYRANICRYAKKLERQGRLQAILKARDRRTGRVAKHYTADPSKWRKTPENAQLSLFNSINYSIKSR